MKTILWLLFIFTTSISVVFGQGNLKLDSCKIKNPDHINLTDNDTINVKINYEMIERFHKVKIQNSYVSWKDLYNNYSFYDLIENYICNKDLKSYLSFKDNNIIYKENNKSNVNSKNIHLQESQIIHKYFTNDSTAISVKY